jgi:hypothetical protein
MRSLLALVLLAACSSAEGEPTASVRSAIIGGAPSDDDAAIYVETRGDDGSLLRCSGRVVAPGLALTARHCVIKRKSTGVLCNPDGSPRDLSDTTDLRPEAPDHVTVFVGASRPSFHAVRVREIVTTQEVSICKADLAFLVLEERGLELRTPLRREAVRLGDTLRVAGWGYTADDQSELPDERSSVSVPVEEIGPGLIPPGTFSVGGNSMCFGDSGAVALIDGAAVGIYSRIDGDAICQLSQSRNIFTAITAYNDVATRAYAAIGEAPWYAGERQPGAASPVLASADAGPPATVPPPAEASCSAAPTPDGHLGAVVAFVLLMEMRRRRRPTSVG